MDGISGGNHQPLRPYSSEHYYLKQQRRRKHSLFLSTEVDEVCDVRFMGEGSTERGCLLRGEARPPLVGDRPSPFWGRIRAIAAKERVLNVPFTQIKTIDVL